MIASTPTKDYLSRRHRNSSMSPSCRPRHSTPPSLVSTHNGPSPSYDSPMLTPSSLRHRPLFPNTFNPDLGDADDLFLQSPYKSPAQAHHHHVLYTSKPQQITPDDDDGSIFLSSSTSFSPFFPTSASQPLLTPVKQIHRFPSPSALSVKPPITTSAPLDPLNSVTRVGVGTKRKSAQHGSTPIRQHDLTPLMITSQRKKGDPATEFAMLDRLAPLPAPKFAAATPQTKAETDAHLRRQTATLTRLRLSDFIEPGNDIEAVDNDSGCEMEDDDRRKALFSDKVQSHMKTVTKGKGKEDEEVAAAISPGGHITKRRARRRPLSAELLESTHRSPSPAKVRNYFDTNF